MQTLLQSDPTGLSPEKPLFLDSYSIPSDCSSDEVLIPYIDSWWVEDERILDELLPRHPTLPFRRDENSSTDSPWPFPTTGFEHDAHKFSSQVQNSENGTSAQAPGSADERFYEMKGSLPGSRTSASQGSKRRRRHGDERKASEAATSANSAGVTALDHVLRERQRRDDMSTKIAVLEGLLPRGPKRDRASIVEDSIQYLKRLQQRVEELKKKSKALTKKGSARSGQGKEVSACSVDCTKKIFVVSFHVQVEDGDGVGTAVDCKCGHNFLSVTMTVLEHLQLDLHSSSLTKMPDERFFCVLAIKGWSFVVNNKENRVALAVQNPQFKEISGAIQTSESTLQWLAQR